MRLVKENPHKRKQNRIKLEFKKKMDEKERKRAQ